MKTGIVILAAGESARMGESKQLLEYRGKTLLKHAVDTALELQEVTVAVVLGADAEKIREPLDGIPVLVVENPDWQSGMGGSIRTGLDALLAGNPGLQSAVFLTCDQPLLTSSILNNLISTHQLTGCPIVASEYAGTLGVPALFHHTLFPELRSLDGAGGARKTILKHRNQAFGVPFPDGAVDIDTPADYKQLRELPTATPV